jgi:hypothetical protein
MRRTPRKRSADCTGGSLPFELSSADQKHYVDQVFRSGVRALAAWQRIRMQLFRELLFRRNDRKRRRRNAAEAKPVFASHNIQGLNHFVSDADVHRKARKIPSVHRFCAR